MHCVEVADLHKPGADALHNLAPSAKPAAPLLLPLEQVARVQVVGAQLKHPTEAARRARRPKAEFLHQRRALALDERSEPPFKGHEVRVPRDGVERFVVAVIALVLPDVH